MKRKTDLMEELMFSISSSIENKLNIEWIANNSLMQVVILKRNYSKLCEFMRLNLFYSKSLLNSQSVKI